MSQKESNNNGAALSVVASEKNLRKIPKLYESMLKYTENRNENEKQKPQSVNDLTLNQ